MPQTNWRQIPCGASLVPFLPLPAATSITAALVDAALRLILAAVSPARPRSAHPTALHQILMLLLRSGIVQRVQAVHVSDDQIVHGCYFGLAAVTCADYFADAVVYWLRGGHEPRRRGRR